LRFQRKIGSQKNATLINKSRARQRSASTAVLAQQCQGNRPRASVQAMTFIEIKS
jgi:hypothetical protein